MKWKVAVVLLVLCAVGACVWAAQSRKPEPVFRGMCWGDPPAKLGDKKLRLWSVAPHTRYMKIGDPLRIDNVELESIEYVFLNDRLVMIEVVGKSYNELRQLAEEEYGTTKQFVMVESGIVYFDATKAPTACMVLEEGVKGRMCLFDTTATAF